jgi:hypothetical protein
MPQRVEVNRPDFSRTLFPALHRKDWRINIEAEANKFFPTVTFAFYSGEKVVELDLHRFVAACSKLCLTGVHPKIPVFRHGNCIFSSTRQPHSQVGSRRRMVINLHARFRSCGRPGWPSNNTPRDELLREGLLIDFRFSRLILAYSGGYWNF